MPTTTRSAPASRAASTGELVAKAAAELDRNAQRGDLANLVEVLGLTRARPVEVHDVQDARRLSLPAPGRVDGIRVVGGLALVVALGQPDDVALANVDRRIEDHAGTAAQIRAKLASRRRPAALDFSGWNWTP